MLEQQRGFDSYMSRPTRDDPVDGDACLEYNERTPPILTKFVQAYKDLASTIAEDVGCVWSGRESDETGEDKLGFRALQFEKGETLFQLRSDIHPLFHGFDNADNPTIAERIEHLTLNDFRSLDTASQTAIKAIFWRKIFEDANCSVDKPFDGCMWRSLMKAQWKPRRTFRDGPSLVEVSYKDHHPTPGPPFRRYQLSHVSDPKKEDQDEEFERRKVQCLFFPEQFRDEFSKIDIVEPCAFLCTKAFMSSESGKGVLYEGHDDDPPYDKLSFRGTIKSHIGDIVLAEKALKIKRTAINYNRSNQTPVDGDGEWVIFKDKFTHRILDIDWKRLMKHDGNDQFFLYKKVQKILDGVIDLGDCDFSEDSLLANLLFCFDGRDFAQQYMNARDDALEVGSKIHKYTSRGLNMESILHVHCWDEKDERRFSHEYHKPKLIEAGTSRYGETSDDKRPHTHSDFFMSSTCFEKI